MTKTATSSVQSAPAEVTEAQIVAQLLAGMKSAENSSSGLLDYAVDSVSGVVDGTARFGGAFLSSFNNAAFAFGVERGVQAARADKRREEIAKAAASRIMALSKH